MWLKVGTRGDYRVIYFIIAFFVFLGIRSAYYQLYDLNNGPEKRRIIASELRLVMPADNRNPNSIVQIQRDEFTEHIGGGRDVEEIMFTSLSQNETYTLFRNSAEQNGWKTVNNGEYFSKNSMKMMFKFVDVSEYTSEKYGVPKHLQGKRIFRIRIEIK
jgi:hypothetical protein